MVGRDLWGVHLCPSLLLKTLVWGGITAEQNTSSVNAKYLWLGETRVCCGFHQQNYSLGFFLDLNAGMKEQDEALCKSSI